MSSRVSDAVPLPPDPPVPRPPAHPDFLVHHWPAGLEMIRCGPRGLDVSRPYVSPRPYRFSPVRSKTGRPVATLYAGGSVRAAIAETVFHDVPPRGGPRSVAYDRIESRVIGRVLPGRALKLADFTTTGLARVGLTPRELTETGPRTYPQTAAWSQAVYDHAALFDGIYWMSRMHNAGPAVVVFGRRVKVGDLRHSKAADLEPLSSPTALDALLGYADDLGIDVAGPPWLRH